MNKPAAAVKNGIKDKTHKPAPTSKEVALPDTEAKADQLPANYLDQFEQDAGVGAEDLSGRNDIAIPFLSILQGLSPEVDPSSPKYIEGATVGMIFNSVTKELMKTVDVIVAKAGKSFIEWVPRDAGGGFRGEHDYDAMLKTFNEHLDPETRKATLANGNNLIETHSFYVLAKSPATGRVAPCIISMASTQIGSARQWGYWLKTMVVEKPDGSSFLPATWAHSFTLSTVSRSNKKGKWSVWAVKRNGWLHEVGLEAQYDRGRLLNKQITGGQITVDRSAQEDSIAGEVVGGGAQGEM